VVVYSHLHCHTLGFPSRSRWHFTMWDIQETGGSHSNSLIETIASRLHPCTCTLNTREQGEHITHQ
jgi:hypothetical protein